jgi:chromosomal replication initiator protein
MRPTIQRIKEVVARVYGVTADTIDGDSRLPEHVRPRHMAVHLAREMLGLGYSELGRAFKRDHSTIHGTCKRMRRAVATDSKAEEAVREVRRRIEEELCGD